MPASNAQNLTIDLDDAGRVSGLLLTPPRARACYVLAHGAGAGMTHPFLQAVAGRFEVTLLAKPFALEQLESRVQGLLRRDAV